MRQIWLCAIMSMIAATADAQNTLPNVGCGLEGQVKSLNAAGPTQVTFVNRESVPIRTYWLNYDGRRVFYREVPPGQSYVQQTYVTHPWVITDNPQGRCVALYQPQPFAADAVIP
jgi:hypothetical protein